MVAVRRTPEDYSELLAEFLTTSVVKLLEHNLIKLLLKQCNHK
jgi:hypothetical protein